LIDLDNYNEIMDIMMKIGGKSKNPPRVKAKKK
jgi:hypothetical protein